jgi:hypothetical protein
MVVRGQFVMRDFTFNILVATGVMVLFGLGNPLFGDYGALPNAVSANTAGSGLYVLAVVCATRALVLAPYFWAKARSSGEIAPTVAIPKVRPGT